jgi:hypothetical protein
MGNVFPARCETVSVPENKNNFSLDDCVRPLGLRCLKRMVLFGSSKKRSVEILAPKQ